MKRYRWDKYCEKGLDGCMDTRCACVDAPRFRYLNARRRGLSRLRSRVYATTKWLGGR